MCGRQAPFIPKCFLNHFFGGCVPRGAAYSNFDFSFRAKVCFGLVHGACHTKAQRMPHTCGMRRCVAGAAHITRTVCAGTVHVLGACTVPERGTHVAIGARAGHSRGGQQRVPQRPVGYRVTNQCPVACVTYLSIEVVRISRELRGGGGG